MRAGIDSARSIFAGLLQKNGVGVEGVRLCGRRNCAAEMGSLYTGPAVYPAGGESLLKTATTLNCGSPGSLRSRWWVSLVIGWWVPGLEGSGAESCRLEEGAGRMSGRTGCVVVAAEARTMGNMGNEWAVKRV